LLGAAASTSAFKIGRDKRTVAIEKMAKEDFMIYTDFLGSIADSRKFLCDLVYVRVRSRSMAERSRSLWHFNLEQVSNPFQRVLALSHEIDLMA
jgi:hypothetical protein